MSSEKLPLYQAVPPHQPEGAPAVQGAALPGNTQDVSRVAQNYRDQCQFHFVLC